MSRFHSLLTQSIQGFTMRKVRTTVNKKHECSEPISSHIFAKKSCKTFLSTTGRVARKELGGMCAFQFSPTCFPPHHQSPWVSQVGSKGSQWWVYEDSHGSTKFVLQEMPLSFPFPPHNLHLDLCSTSSFPCKCTHKLKIFLQSHSYRGIFQIL